MEGNFALSDRVPPDRVAPVLGGNAPAMLFSMARAVLATAMGRGPFRRLRLLSVHFMNLSREAAGEDGHEIPAEKQTPTARRRKRALEEPQKGG